MRILSPAMGRSQILIILAFLYSGLGACGGETRNQLCHSNRECGAGQLCLAGRCQVPSRPAAVCQSDLDCPPNQSCDLALAQCVNLDAGLTPMADAASSSTAPDASPGGDGGMDMSLDASTSSLSDAGHANGVDAGMSMICAMDSDCSPPISICESNQCIASCVVPGGLVCAADEVCDSNTGRCVVVAGPCVQDSECAPPMTVCEGGQCVGGCDEPGGIQCVPGEICDLITGRCAAGGPICLSDLDCNRPSEICNLYTGACEAGCQTTGCTPPAMCDLTSGHCVGSSNTACVVDMFEPNNSANTAATIGAGVAFGLSACPGDDDYFQVDMFAGDQLEVILDYTFGEGNLGLQLIDPSGSVLQTSNATSGVELITVASAPADGLYAVRVYLIEDLGPITGSAYGIRIVYTPTSSGGARISCTGLSCRSTPSPLPHSATAQRTWNPCNGGFFTWSAQGQFESRYDRACVGGVATPSLSGSCSGGTQLNGSGPWSGSASGNVVVSIATDGSISSIGLTSLVASCGGSGSTDAGSNPPADAGLPSGPAVVCSGLSCFTTPSPLPNYASAQTSWTPCGGGAFTWTAQGQFETNYDRACVGGVASSGFLNLCSSGSTLNGSGPWNGSGSGTVVVSFGTDVSIQSVGITSLVATCTGGSGSSDAGVADAGASSSVLGETEPNETANTANVTNVSGAQVTTVEGQVSPVGDVDWYSFMVVPGQYRTLVATVYSWPGSHTSCMGDPRLFLLNASGTTMAEDDADGFVQCSKIDGTGADTGAANLPVGMYFLRIEQDGNTSIVPRYFIDIELR